MLVEAQRALPYRPPLGRGQDVLVRRPAFPRRRHGEADERRQRPLRQRAPGVKLYTHLSDQYAPFATPDHPGDRARGTLRARRAAAPTSGPRIKEHYTDTGGFTDHVFASCAILGFRFAPRIRDLADKRLYAFDPGRHLPRAAPR